MRTSKTALVTGASGFIGQPVAAALARQGTKVIALDPLAPDPALDGCRFITGSFVDRDLLARIFAEEGIDTVVHTGGISGPMLARDDPYGICTINVVGTMNLLEAARVHKVERFVYCGSAQAFGDTPPPPVPDDAPLRATDVYGATKGAGDLLLSAYRTQHGLDAVSLRISNCYGPRRRTRCAIRLMLEAALAGKPIHFDWGRGYGRAYLYVDDTVSAITAAVAADSFNQWAYNIAGSEFTSMEQVADVVRTLVPGAEISMDEGGDALGYRREALDISAAARDLGWQPRFGIEAGTRAYRDWMAATRS